MKFLYKIWSGYDGFAPRRLPDRLIGGKDLTLGWHKYIDSVERGNEVWIYFYGPHRFTPGVYVRGFVRTVDPDHNRVVLRVRKASSENPLTDAETSDRIGQVVAVKNRQVFLFPEKWDTAPHCTLHTVADSCANRLCDNCSTWSGLPLIKSSINWPHRIPAHVVAFAPAYWVIPSRCYLHRVGTIANAVRRTSQVFMRFKVGEEALAYPLALGMYNVLMKRGLSDFDAVVPIPLSPDKEKSGEIHRTKLLARELCRLLGAHLASVLSLRHAISKHKLRIHSGLSVMQFEARYAEAVDVDTRVREFRRILLIDDVCTEGSTLRCAVQALRAVHPNSEITLATAGQMIVKNVVKHEGPLLAPGAAVA